MPPPKVMLIRHAEKPGDPLPSFGVKEDGTRSQHSIVVQGWQRAGALIAFFAAPTLAEIAVPAHLYAASFDKSADPSSTSDVEDISRSRRAIETITPLAHRLGLTADQTFAVGDEDRLSADLLLRDGVVLVAWEHKHLPVIAAHLTPAAPNTWPGDRFDVVWVFDRESSGSYRFLQVAQKLLAGDS
jgi:hypothetical protein